jgi:hypothetical protein
MGTNEEMYRDLQKRVERLEKAIFPVDGTSLAVGATKKMKSLPELVKARPPQNGQQRVAAIVGYIEKMEKRTAIKLPDIKKGWAIGKFDGGFANVLVTRAVKDGLIADYNNDGSYVLTQSGESFWEQLNSAEA